MALVALLLVVPAVFFSFLAAPLEGRPRLATGFVAIVGGGFGGGEAACAAASCCAMRPDRFTGELVFFSCLETRPRFFELSVMIVCAVATLGGRPRPRLAVEAVEAGAAAFEMRAIVNDLIKKN